MMTRGLPHARRGAPARFVGRDSELAVVVEGLRAAAAGSGRVVVIEGGAGQGKTTLVQTALDVVGSGVDVVAVEADELSRDVPFAALATAVRLPVRTFVDDPVRDIAYGDPSFAIVEHAVAELEQRANAAPVVVLVDNLQWADAATLVVVRRLVQRAPHLPLSVVATVRDRRSSEAVQRLVDGVAAGPGDVLTLPPLSTEEVAALVEQALLAAPDERLAAVLDAAGGNPLFVLELVEALRRDDALVLTGAAATTTYEANLRPALHLTLLRRLAELPQHTLHLLTLASVLGSTFRVPELAALAGMTSVELVSGLRPALSARAVIEREGALAFHHDLVREALYDDLPAPLRAELHLKAADVLPTVAPGDPRVAEHLLLGVADDDPRAPRLLLQAATAFAELSLRAAVPVLERALAVTPASHPLHAEIVAELANALVHIGRAEEGGALACAALQQPVTGDAAVRLYNAAQAAVANLGRNSEAAEIAELAAQRPDFTDIDRAAFLARAAASRLLQLDDLESLRQQAEQALQVAQQHPDSYVEVVATVTLALVAQADGDLDLALARARRSHDIALRTPVARSGYLTPFRVLAWLLTHLDRLDEADAVARAGMSRAEATSNVGFLPHFHSALATTAFLRGRLDDASAEAHAMHEVVHEGEVRHSALLGHALQVRIATMRDDLQLARTALAAAHEHLRHGGSGVGFDWLVWAEALLLEESGAAPDAATALRDSSALFAPVRRLADARLIGPELVRLARRSYPEVARAAADEVVQASAAAGGIPSLVGAAHRCTALLERDADAALAAVEAYRASPRVLDLARGCEDAAGVLVDCDRRTEAAALLQEALDIYDGVLATRDASRVRGGLRQLGVHRRAPARARRAAHGWESLTDTELRVVRLVAAGLTNRQVGERLYISPRTVETHLSRVFGKLGVPSRSGVVAAAVGRGLVDDLPEQS